jgi:hypothetical protein
MSNELVTVKAALAQAFEDHEFIGEVGDYVVSE